MKKIAKNSSPPWFEDWKRDFKFANGRDAHYKDDFSTDDTGGRDRRRRLKQQLIREQGEICCYCMKRIGMENSHIEHFWPKSYFKSKDMDYNNLFASCNGTGGFDWGENCGHKKEDWYINGMLPPTDEAVEKIFTYSPNGKIRIIPGKKESDIAQNMIKNIGLDSFHLERERRGAIECSEFFDNDDYTEEDIWDFIDYYSNMDNGQYVPYCKAIVDCLKTMI